jgi:AraC family transcriptional regulator, transcriptional activator FtrA
VASPGVPLFELAIPAEVFGTDRRDLTPHWYHFELVTCGPDTDIGHGLQVPAGRGPEALAEADTIVVPACADVHDQAPADLIEALRDAASRGARLASICSGAFVLAQAGLLDGRRATTHWMHAEELAARYPRVRVDPKVLYVHDQVWTSAGSAAGLDMCLEIVRHDHGAAVANEVARRLVTPPHRHGGQAQYVRVPARSGAPDQDIEAWARQNLATTSVTDLARQAGVSARTLHRQFLARTGRSPQEWLQGERVRAAAELLETTSLTTDVIASRVGLGSATNLRARFATSYGIPPAEYRRTFTTSRRPA